MGIFESMIPRDVMDRLVKSGINDAVIQKIPVDKDYKDYLDKTISDVLQEGLCLFTKENSSGIFAIKENQVTDAIRFNIADLDGNIHTIIVIDSLGSVVIDKDAWSNLSKKHMAASMLTCPDSPVEKKKKQPTKNKPYYRSIGKKARWACG